MSENETQSAGDPVSATQETERSEVNVLTKKSPVAKYTTAVVIVAVILLGVLYFLEKEGRSSTSLFTSVIESQKNGAVVAVVNGTEIVGSELNTSIQQFSQAAAAQGVDATSTEAQAEIRSQALDVLINTELLKQAARERGISITDEQVTERLEEIKTEIGGEAVLIERMTALGIDDNQLQSDVRDELLINELLDAVFLEAEIEVTEEEIASVYENAGGVEAGLPALEEVRSQVEEQIVTSKKQAAIDEYLTKLKADAQIEIK